MKRVNNADVFVKLNPKIININNFTIKFYTVNAESFFIYKTNEDVIPIQREVTIDDVDAIISGETAVTEYYIKLYWSELLTLGEGVLQYLVLNSTKYLDRTTEFYINSNIIVDDESGSTYPEVIAELGAKIDGEIERSTSADTEHQEAINDEIATRQQNVLELTDLLVNDYYTKTEVDSRIESASTPTDLSNYYTKSEVDTAIANVDVTDQLSGYVETTDFNTYSGDTDTKINSKLDATAYTPTDLSNYYNKSQVYNKTEVDSTIGTVNGKISSISGVVDTKLDSTAYTPTDLSDYYTKTEVDDKITQSGTFDPTQYYNKTDVDGKVSTLSGAIDTKLDATAYTPTDLSNYYQKSETSGATEISTALASKLDSTAYTPTDLSNYYNKSQVYNKTEIDAAISGKVESADLASVATSGDYDDLTNKPTLFSGSYNDLTNKPTLFSGDYNDLSNKPTIPTVPTNVSDFTNDAGYLTQHQDISGKLNVSDFNSYSSSTATAIGSKLDSTAYTPTDLTNYYTKSETSGATEISTALGNKQDTLTSGTNIKTINNTSILGSGNITIEGGSGSSGFIQVTNPDTADTKVGLVNSLSQYYDTNIGQGAVIEGDGYEYNGTIYNIVASGDSSHAEGSSTQASGDYSHAEGSSTVANGPQSHAEGGTTIASNWAAHAEGQNTQALGQRSHAEGNYTKAIGDNSHAEGSSTSATSDSSHAEGNNTKASGYYSHAEGGYTIASGDYSHAEGNYTTAVTYYTHAEGTYTNANGSSSHAEGSYTNAIGSSSHAEGSSTLANGNYSHAEGYTTTAVANYTHAEGYSTIAKNQSEHASGQYNVSSSASTTFGDSGNTLFSVGNGTSQALHNAFEIRQNGDIYITSGSTDIKLQDHLGGGGGSSTPIVILTQAEYNALATKDNNTIYIIKDD